MLYVGTWKDTKNEEIDGEVIELGSRLVKYIPTKHIKISTCNEDICVSNTYKSADEIIAETINNFKNIEKKQLVDLREIEFKNALLDFYTKCEENRKIYSLNNFITYFNHLFFLLPQNHITVLSENIDKLFSPLELPFDNNKNLTQTCYNVEKDTIGYYMAVAYELIKHNYTVNKCVDCGNWFVAYNKVDTKFCPECKKKMLNLRHNNRALKNKYLERCRNKAYYTEELYLLEEEIAKRYDEANTTQKQEAYSKWLKNDVNAILLKRVRKNS